MISADSIRLNTVNILIGENGAGKSLLLRKLCATFLRRGEKVMAISPAIYDRFRRMPTKGLRFFGGRSGRTAAVKIVRRALERAVSKNTQILKNLTQALRHTKFDPVIGISARDIDLDPFRDASTKNELGAMSREDKEALESTLIKWQNRYGQEDGLARIALDEHSFAEFDVLSFAKLAQHERILLATGTVSRIGYCFFRNGEPIPLLEACSGELCFITTIAFISTEIERGSVIAIDEPESSLHPTWQQNYVQTLLDLFHRYEPRILISTHSPIIISGANADRINVIKSEVNVFEMADGQTRLFDHAQHSLEEMYDRLFGIITPRNHYLSQRAVALLNDLNARRLGIDQVTHELQGLKQRSYDDSQKGVITKVEEMARELNAKR